MLGGEIKLFVSDLLIKILNSNPVDTCDSMQFSIKGHNKIAAFVIFFRWCLSLVFNKL